MASTGFSLDAEYDGTIPATSPIKTETEIPITMFKGVSCKVNGKFFESNTRIYTMSNPTKPPKSDRKTDSIRN